MNMTVVHLSALMCWVSYSDLNTILQVLGLHELHIHLDVLGTSEKALVILFWLILHHPNSFIQQWEGASLSCCERHGYTNNPLMFSHTVNSNCCVIRPNMAIIKDILDSYLV